MCRGYAYAWTVTETRMAQLKELGIYTPAAGALALPTFTPLGIPLMFADADAFLYGLSSKAAISRFWTYAWIHQAQRSLVSLTSELIGATRNHNIGVCCLGVSGV